MESGSTSEALEDRESRLHPIPLCKMRFLPQRLRWLAESRPMPFPPAYSRRWHKSGLQPHLFACSRGYGLSCVGAIPSGWRNYARPVHTDGVSGAGDGQSGIASRAFQRTSIRPRLSQSQPRQTWPTHHSSTSYQPSATFRLAGSMLATDESPSAQVAQAEVLGHGRCAGPLSPAPLFCDPFSISSRSTPDGA